MSSKISFRKLFYNKKFLVIFSLILSMFFWTQQKLADTKNNSHRQMTVTVDLSTTHSTASQFTAIGNPNYKVTVYLSGPLDQISKLTAADISVTPKFNQVDKAKHYDNLDLNKPTIVNGSVSSVTVDNYTPKTVSVYYDKNVTKQFDVKIDSPGLKAATGFLLDTPGFTNTQDEKINISGPQTAINNIDTVVAVVNNIVPLSDKTSMDAELKLFDANNNEINPLANYLTFSSSKVNITANVFKQGQLSVSADFADQPKYFTDNPKLISTSVMSLNVYGPVSTAWSQNALTTESIDFSNVSLTNTSFTSNIVLPSDITAAPSDVSKTSGVKISVNLNGFTDTKLDINNIQAIPQSLATGLTFTAKATTGVKFVGLKQHIKTLKAADIVGNVDLSKITSAGSYTLPITFTCAKYDDVWASGSYQVIVDVS